MKRKVIAIVLTFCMVLTMTPVAMAVNDAGYTDTDGHWAENVIDRWSDYGIVQGDGESFFPDEEMTRGQAAAVFARLLGLTKIGDISGYDDLSDSEFAESFAKCVAAGIMNGVGDTKMDPDGTLTREQMFVMFGRAMGIEPQPRADKNYADSHEVSEWAEGMINALTNLGYVNGTSDSELSPGADINRASVMALLDQTIVTYVTEDGATVEADGGLVLVVAEDVKVTGEASDVVVAQGSSDSKVVLEDLKVSGTVTVAAEDVVVEATGETKAESVVVTPAASNSSVEIGKNVEVTTVKTEAENSTIDVSGKVDNVEVTETATNTQVGTTSGSTIGSVNNAAEGTTVTGAGKVDSVTTTGNNTTVETGGTKVEAAEGTTGTTAGGTTVEGGSAATTTPTTPSTGGSSHSHNYTTLIVEDGIEYKECSCGERQPTNNVYEAKIGDTYYAELQDALAIGGTVIVQKNIDLEKDQTVEVADSVTLDLNGYVINVYGSFTNKGTISGNGVIDVFGSDGVLENSGNITLGKDSLVGIEKGATLNNTGTIDAEINVADYLYEGKDEISVVNGADNVIWLAVAFTPEQVQNALNNDKYAFVMASGTGTDNTVEVGGITVPEGRQLMLKGTIFDGEKTLQNNFVVGEGKTLTISGGETVIVNAELVVSGVVNVYGALLNYGTISGAGMIDAFGGYLENGGTIELETSGVVALERGAELNNYGTINAGIEAADYLYDEENIGISIEGDVDNLTYIAVAFTPEKVQNALDDSKYDLVMASGTGTDNTVELGGITVPEGEMLMLKGSIFDGEKTLQNSYVVSEENTLTISEGATVIVRDNTTFALEIGSAVNVYGDFVNNGSIDGNGKIDVFGGYLANGGTIELGTGGLVGLERGGFLKNYTGDTPGIINAEIDFVDYWYEEDNVGVIEESSCELLDGDTVLTDNTVVYIAVASTPDMVNDALNATDEDGQDKYSTVIACGMEENNTVELNGITVPAGKMLILKNSVFIGNVTANNEFVLNSNEAMNVSEGATVIIFDNTTLTLEKDSVVNVYGEFINNGNIGGNGIIDAFDGNVDNNGTIELGEGGAVALERGSVLNNNGTINAGI